MVGCVPLLNRNIKRALVFDIGGGSTEISLARITNTGNTFIASNPNIIRTIDITIANLGRSIKNLENYINTHFNDEFIDKQINEEELGTPLKYYLDEINPNDLEICTIQTGQEITTE